jgi:hypothetical protein
MTEREKKFFDAGEKLRGCGASFFVSYLYWKLIDPTHTNWKLAKTNNPITVLNNKEYWFIWADAIVYKSPRDLGTNRINLSGYEIISMAEKLVEKLKKSPEFID